MTQKEILKEAKAKYISGMIIRSAWTNKSFILNEGFTFRFDGDGDLRAGNTNGNPVIWVKDTNKWASIISSPKPIINNQIIDNYEIY